MKRSKNLKEFFSNTRESFRGKHGTAILATLISVFPFMVILFAAAWLSQIVHGMFAVIAIIALVCYGCAQVGHIRFIRQLANDEHPTLGVLFSGFKEMKTPFYLFLGIVLMIIYLISGLLLVVPLFFAIGMFSMVFYFVEHHKFDTVLDALSTTEKKMRRQKGNMFAYKWLFYIFYAVLMILFIIGIVFLSKIEALAVSVIALVILHVAFYIVFSIITTYFSFCNYNFFMEVLEYHERMSNKPSPEIPSEEKKEEEKIKKVSVAEKPAETSSEKKVATTKKPASATKATAAKSATTKTTATKKTVEKKTETKKEEK